MVGEEDLCDRLKGRTMELSQGRPERRKIRPV